ncbi:MAG: tetratricopeptide repeat protein [Prevotella sp.]|nr:tetratricopeptide repeat protein [Prevotella sp.]
MAKKKKPTKGNQELSEALNKSEAFFEKYKKVIIGCLVALVVLIVAITMYKNYAESRNEKASTALAKCQELFMMQNFDKALKGDSLGAPGFIQIANDYSSTKAGNLAKLYAGLCYAKQDKWQEAVKYLDDFDTKDDMMVSPLAMVAVGDAYANVKQLDKAIDAFKKAASMADKATDTGYNNTVSPIALQKAAIILIDQKKNDEALKIFQDIKAKYLGSPVQQDVDKYIEYLTK